MAAHKKTGGRKAGTPNKVNAALRDLACDYTEPAILALVGIMNDTGAPPAARVAAASAVLDRGHGKPSQALEHGGVGSPFVIYIDKIDAMA